MTGGSGTGGVLVGFRRMGQAMVWTILFLSIMRIYTEGSVMAAYLGTVQLLQLELVSVLGFWFTMALEAGVLVATWTVVRQIMQGERGWVWSGGV